MEETQAGETGEHATQQDSRLMGLAKLPRGGYDAPEPVPRVWLSNKGQSYGTSPAIRYPYGCHERAHPLRLEALAVTKYHKFVGAASQATTWGHQ